MSARHDGGSAFPVSDEAARDKVAAIYGGMTLRDYFAAKVMQGLCANPSVFASDCYIGVSLANGTESQLCEIAYRCAGEMLRVRSEP